MIVTGASGFNTQESDSLIRTAVIMASIGTLVQLFTVWKLGALSQIICHKPVFNLGAIVSVTMILLVSVTETIGDTSAITVDHDIVYKAVGMTKCSVTTPSF